MLEWLLVAGVSLLGGFVTGAAGFGFGLVTTPILLWVLSAPMVVITNLATSVALRVPLLWVDRRHISLSQAAPLILGGALGMPLGVLVLTRFSDDEVRISAGVLIIFLSIAQLIGSERLAPLNPRRGLTGLSVGAASGALNTSISLSGPPMVLWLLNQGMRGKSFRGTISAASLILNAVGIVLLIKADLAQTSWLLLPLAAYPAAATGAWLGNSALRHMSPGVFGRVAALGVIVVSFVAVVGSLL